VPDSCTLYFSNINSYANKKNVYKSQREQYFPDAIFPC